MSIINYLKYVKKIIVRNAITGKSSSIDFVEIKLDTRANRKKLEVAGIDYQVTTIISN